MQSINCYTLMSSRKHGFSHFRNMRCVILQSPSTIGPLEKHVLSRET